MQGDGSLFYVPSGTEEAPFFTFNGCGIVVMNGLVSGESEGVRRQVDGAFQPLFEAGLSIYVLVRTNYPSFTLPTPSVRYGIFHTRKYLPKVVSIIFLDLPSAFSKLFWVACKALPSFVKDKVVISSSDKVEEEMSLTLSSIVPPTSSFEVVEEGGRPLLKFKGKKKGGIKWKEKTFEVSVREGTYFVRWTDVREGLRSDAFKIVSLETASDEEIELRVEGRPNVRLRQDVETTSLLVSVLSNPCVSEETCEASQFS